MNKIAVEGCIIDHAAGSAISGGSFTIITPPNTFCKAEGKKMYFGPMAFAFTGGSAAGCTSGSVTGDGTIAPRAAKVKNGVLFAVLEGDTGTLAGAGVAPNGTSVPVSGSVEISDAGQGKASAQ